MNIELLGYIAGIIVSISLMPQVVKAWKTKSTKDISITWNSIYLFGIILWVIYGFSIKNYPVAIMMGIEGLLALTLLTLKVRYK
ncbi:MAG: hypothetical protein ACD_51C00096G0003 [uncultured bacterium]|nr:MAG: hypothetical protein ACD_51C00096G0003 [uncultured bacterium]